MVVLSGIVVINLGFIFNEVNLVTLVKCDDYLKLINKKRFWWQNGITHTSM
jgi:hypothetical protein